MSVLNAIRSCPCGTWRCRIYRRLPLLGGLAAIGDAVVFAHLPGLIGW